MKNKNEEIEQFLEEFADKFRFKKFNEFNVVQIVTEMLRHKMVKENWSKNKNIDLPSQTNDINFNY